MAVLSLVMAIAGVSGRSRPGRGARPAIDGPPKLVPLLAVLGSYEGVLLDQFGVLHDGKTPFPGSQDAVRHAQAVLRKRMVVLSNSSKRRLETINRLHALGLGMCTWLDSAKVADDVPLISAVTSGDMVFNALREATRATEDGFSTDGALFRISGSRCLVFGNGDDDAEYVTAAGAEFAPVDDADFLLARGLFALCEHPSPEAHSRLSLTDQVDGLMARALERGLPMIVANPDTVRPDGKDSPMPGILGARYAAMGGEVFNVGKPYGNIYAEALRVLAADGLGQEDIVAVGDSMDHDVLGACRAGVDSVLITAGIHAAELGVPQGAGVEPDPGALASFLSRYPRDQWPTYVCAGFKL